MRTYVTPHVPDRVGQMPTCPGTCTLRKDPSVLSPTVALLGPNTPINFVYSVSPTGWVHVQVQTKDEIMPSGSRSIINEVGWVRASELIGIAVPSPLSPLGRFGNVLQRRDEPTSPFQTRPDVPLPPTEPATPAPTMPPVTPASPVVPVADILPSPTKTIYATIGEIAILTSPAWAPMVLSAIFSPPR